MTAGRVGKPHGLDGSFYVDRPQHELAEGTELVLAGGTHRVERRAGTDDRPLIRLAGVEDPGSLRGELLLVEDELGEGEWLAADLVGLEVPGMGTVSRVIDAPSCISWSWATARSSRSSPTRSRASTGEAGEIRVKREFLP